MAENASDVSLHFLDYWRVIRNRAPLICTILLLTLISGYVTSTYYMTKIFAATVEIQVQKKDQDISVFGPSSDYAGFDQVFFQSAFEVIQSKKTLYKVIEKLELNKVYAKRYAGSDTPWRLDQTYDVLLRNLEVAAKRGSNIIDITVYSDVPEETAQVANEIANAYIESRRGDDAAKYERGLENLKTQVDSQQKVVQAARDHIEELRKDLKVDDVPGSQGQSQLIDLELQRKSSLRDDAASDLNARSTRLTELQKLPPDKLLDALTAFDLADSNLVSLQQQQLALEADIARLIKSGVLENHPDVQSRMSSLQKVKEQLNGLVQGKLQALAIEVQVSKNRLEQLDQEVQDLTEKARKDKTEKLFPFSEAQKEADRQQMLLDQLNIRYKQESVDTQQNSDPATLLSAAEVSDLPVKPNLKLNLVLSAAVGIVLGLSLAFFIEYLDTSVKTMTDVERFIGLPVLAVIPRGMKRLNQPDAEMSQSEPYRILRAKIHLARTATLGNSITVVSGGPGEGKSTTLFNLACVSAQSGQSVLLIDADLRRPMVHRILGIQNNHGLADFLTGKSDSISLIQSTDIPNLHVMTSGEIHSEELGLFSARKIQELLDDMRQRYDLVLFDSPPVLGISDASIIAHAVDATLLVIQHRRYPRDIALRAKRAIMEVRGNLVGVVLNAVMLQADDAYYYYSSYGSYYSRDDKKRNSESKKTKGRKDTAKAKSENGSANGGSSF